ncbi:MAG: exodeoxyribonuclease III, partial [Bauldia litoralis]
DWWGRQPDGRRILVGDLDVAPLETDVWSHMKLLKIISHTPIEVEHYEAMGAAQGWVDALRHFVDPDEKLYSWWSYRARDWRAADKGRRLDHVWVTPNLTESLAAATVLKDARGWEKASDHAPILVDFKD